MWRLGDGDKYVSGFVLLFLSPFASVSQISIASISNIAVSLYSISGLTQVIMELLHRFLTPLFFQDVIVTMGVERQCKLLLGRNL